MKRFVLLVVALSALLAAMPSPAQAVDEHIIAKSNFGGGLSYMEGVVGNAIKSYETAHGRGNYILHTHCYNGDDPAYGHGMPPGSQWDCYFYEYTPSCAKFHAVHTNVNGYGPGSVQQWHGAGPYIVSLLGVPWWGEVGWNSVQHLHLDANEYWPWGAVVCP